MTATQEKDPGSFPWTPSPTGEMGYFFNISAISSAGYVQISESVGW